ncbi:transcription elongation factor GreB [Gillisia mitskevichiae]|uniref:Transcription elongation factor GreB n=1 Tax=Gillisia mitskevichiae TaxID=270921 RepID=A0A495PTE0_9FLAO|nr:GreA/GreB family elongation factor [Gillisia mitskevichiae]RKS53015.1 transcription elongation factor GreB [Gillisia mitskevichiae]
MSRGFVKEDDQEEAPFIPARAVLPPGEINYVTPFGYEKLIKERSDLENDISNLDLEEGKERRHTMAILNGKLNLLNERILSSRILDPKEQPQEEVRFGALISFKFLTGEQQGVIKEFQIVGVDEANIKENKIAFVAPLAKALTGKKRAEIAEVFMAGKLQELEILSIKY